MTLKSSEELVLIHEQYYVIKNKMYALLVCFVRDGGCFRGRGRERGEIALGKIIANQYQSYNVIKQTSLTNQLILIPF